MQVTALGAIAALTISIILIVKKVHPAYSLITGAIFGGLIGGAGLTGTVDLMMSGAQDMIPAILRILTAGILAGVLIQSGAASKIAETIIEKIGESNALLALALATMILTSVGVFVDVAIITVSSIALEMAKRTGLSKMAILLAMSGGGKAGNIMSANPNTIAAADNFGVPLTSVMLAGVIPAIFGVIVAFLISKKLSNKGTFVKNIDEEEEKEKKPNFFPAMVGPLVAIILLMLRPTLGINVDPLLALPIGGICGAFAMGKLRYLKKYAQFGIANMGGVAILLIGTGTLAGIIANSGLKDIIIQGINILGLPSFALAPISGILMGAATASTTSGTAVASSVFGPTVLELGVSGLSGAAMIHAGATVLDHLPHGSLFHSTAGCVNMDIKERFKLIPYECLVGLTLTIVSTIIFGFIIR